MWGDSRQSWRRPLCALVVLLAAAPGGARALPAGVRAERWVTGLGFPTALAPAPDGRVLVAEKGGALRLVAADGTLQDAPVATVAPRTDNEAGLVGLALAPDFAETGEFVIAYTPAADPAALHLARLRLEGAAATVLADPWVRFPSLPGAERHFGGGLAFDAQGRLYVALGELNDPARARDPAAASGGLVRLEPDGSLPAEGPFGAGRPAWAIGLRNPFALDVAADGTVWVADNGPAYHDELDRVVAGGDYGWPLMLGFCDQVPLLEVCRPDFVEPVFEWADRGGPSGLVVYEADALPDLAGDVLVAGWHTARVDRFRAGAGGVEALEPFFVHPGVGHEGGGGHEDEDDEVAGHAGLTALAVAADGALLVAAAGAEGGELLRIAREADLRDPAQVVEEGHREPGPPPDPAPACGVAGPGPAAGALLLLGLLAWRRRGRVVRGAALALVLAVPGAAGAAGLEPTGSAGLTLGTVYGDNDDGAGTRVGFAFGAGGRLALAPWAGVGAELMLVSHGAGIRHTDSRLVLLGLHLPVLAEVGWTLGAVRPRLFAGPVGMLRLTGETAGERLDGLASLGAAAAAGVGVELPLARARLGLEIRYEVGLTNLYDVDARPAYLHPQGLYPRTAYLLLRLRP